MVVNFSKYSEFELKRSIEQSVPSAAAVKVCRYARYLGFVVGPDARDHVWKAPCGKMMKRARHVKSLGLSLREAAVAYQVFVFSVVRYVLQLVLPTPILNWNYNLSLDVSTSTPRYSLGVGVLCHLRTLGCPGEFPHLGRTSTAATYTTALRSEVLQRLVDKLEVLRSSDERVFQPRHEVWMSTSSVTVLTEVRARLSAIPAVVAMGSRQSGIIGVLRGQDAPISLLLTLVRRLSYFGFRNARERALCFITNIRIASRKLRPFVVSSMVKTVCNAHATTRRFRGAGGHPFCRLGCSAVGGDDIMHYPHCPVVREFINEVTGVGGFDSLLWALLTSIGHYMILFPVYYTDVLRTVIWNDVIVQAANANRASGGRGVDAGKNAMRARLRTIYARIPRARLVVEGPG